MGSPYDEKLVTVYRMPEDPGAVDWVAADAADLLVNPEGLVLVDRVCPVPLLDPLLPPEELEALARAGGRALAGALDLGGLREGLGADRWDWLSRGRRP